MRDHKIMRTLVFLISLVLCTSYSFSQDSSSLTFKSLTHAVGFYQLQKLDGRSGISVSFQATFQINNHLLASSVAVGYGILNEEEILKNTIHTFFDINLLYGREFEIIDNVLIDVFSGIGYLKQTKLKNASQGSSLNIPVRAKLMFAASDRVRLGFLTQFNFNSENNISMYQFFLQFEL
tara:strand:- start:3020 stop:3556 length:537 start_codon:yes stop_codon:yes gene_type:complete